MTSTFASNSPFHTHQHHYDAACSPISPQYYHNSHPYLPPTPQSALPSSEFVPHSSREYPHTYDTSAIIAEAVALLQQPVSFYNTNTDNTARLGNFTPNYSLSHHYPSTPAPTISALSDHHQQQQQQQQQHASSVITAADVLHWQQHARMYSSSMGAPVQIHGRSNRAKSHQRTPSASTVASNGPASPYVQGISNPHIASSDFSPDSPVHYAADHAGQSLFSKHLNPPTPTYTPTDSNFGGNTTVVGYLPSQAAHHMPSAHQAMKSFAIDHHTAEDFAPEYNTSSRQSMSSYGGNESPSTPQSGVGEPVHNGQYAVPTNGATFPQIAAKDVQVGLLGDTDYRQMNPNVQLFRTESQAYQDELYNPPTVYTTSQNNAAKPSHNTSNSSNNYLSPHRNLVTERLQTANIARSMSPVSAMSRERSPFRDGSQLAPAGGWRTPGPVVGTAAGMRQHQKEQAEQQELAQHRPALRREPTKTISPKDALLDYNEQEQPSLFQDSIPAGYKSHNGGTEQWSSNTFVSQPGAAFGNLTTPGQGFTGFRATPADGYPPSDNMGFAPLPPHDQSQIHNASYLGAYPNLGSTKMDSSHVDANPPFPANLTSMESSMSDNGPPVSSQESGIMNASSLPRPSDTRAATGAYTCTYHGCTQRFDSHANLQRHKRDIHRSHQQHTRDGSGSSSATASASPRSSESPIPTTDGMTSAAIMARNSQAGPHKCTRTNPSTGKPCNTIFSRPYDLTRHEDTIHNNRKQKVRCPMCREEKTFSRNDALTRHMRVVHPEVEAYGKRGRRGD